MAENKELAHRILEDIRLAMADLGIKYDNMNPDKLDVRFAVKSNDIPIILKIEVLEKEEMVSLTSRLPVIVPKEKKFAISLAVNIINYGNTPLGAFGFNFRTGALTFKSQACYKNSKLSKEVYKYMIENARISIDQYNEVLFKLSKGHISLRDFFKMHEF